MIDFKPSGQKAMNYLVRGTIPLYFDIQGSGSTFADDEIQEALRGKTNDPGFDLTGYNLILVTLVEDSTGVEGKSLQYEATSLADVGYPLTQKRLTPNIGPTYLVGNHSQHAQIFWWPMAGGCQPAQTGNCSANCAEVRHYDIAGLVDWLQSNLTSPLSGAELKNGIIGRVIYFHCQTGTDRTGMLDLSYRMTVSGDNFTKAVNNAINSCKPCVMRRIDGSCGPPADCISAAARPMWQYLCLAQAYCHSFHDLRDCGFAMTCGDVDKLWCRDNSPTCD
ncbi:MAG: hypothetical protein ABIK12_03850 [Pseudomonadota bacterium]